MRKFKGYVRTNIVGSKVDFQFEIDDECSEEEIEEIAREAMFDRIDWGYDEISDFGNKQVEYLKAK